MRRSPAPRGLRPAAFFVLAAALTGLTAASLPAQAADESGPWTKLKNGYFTTARMGWLSTSKYFDENGDEVDATGVDYRDATVNFEAEYGLSNRMDLIVGAPLSFRNLGGDALPLAFENDGIGDLTFGLKYGFLAPTNSAAVALEIDAVAPTGYNAHGYGIPPLGNGYYNTWGRVHAGYAFSMPLYVSGSIGYRLYTHESASDATTYRAEAGLFATRRLLVTGEYEGQSAKDTDLAYFQSFTRAGGLVTYRLKPGFDVLAGARATLDGKNVNKGTEVRLGVSLKGNDLAAYRGQASAGVHPDAFPGYTPKPRVTPKAAPTPVPAPVPAPATSAPADSAATPPPAPSTPETPK